MVVGVVVDVIWTKYFIFSISHSTIGNLKEKEDTACDGWIEVRLYRLGIFESIEEETSFSVEIEWSWEEISVHASGSDEIETWSICTSL